MIFLTPDFYNQIPPRLRSLICGTSGGKIAFKPTSSTFNVLSLKLMVTVKQAGIDTTRGAIIRILNQFIEELNPAGPCATPYENQARYRFEHGRLKKECEIDSWTTFTNLLVYEIKSSPKYLHEIALAEIALTSPLVDESYGRAYPILNGCFVYVYELLKNMRLADPEQEKKRVKLTEELENKYYRGHFDGDKRYGPYTPGIARQPLGEAALLPASDLSLDQKIVILHDLLKLLSLVFKFDPLLREMGIPSNPMLVDISAQVSANEWQPRSDKVAKKRSLMFARELGNPSEDGPSLTTTHFVSVNRIRDVVCRSAKDHGKKTLPAMATTLSNEDGVHMVWGIFGYWALRYRKSLGVSHAFYEICAAAAQLGYHISSDKSAFSPYPTLDDVRRRLQSDHRYSFVSDLRKRALLLGFEQALLADYEDTSPQTRQAFEDDLWYTGLRSMNGVSVWRNDLPNPWDP